MTLLEQSQPGKAGLPFKDDRKRAFLNSEGADRPLVSPVSNAVLDRARGYRRGRLRAALVDQDVAAALLYDPVNIRYALDCPTCRSGPRTIPFATR
jgi:hypothetical protein